MTHAGMPPAIVRREIGQQAAAVGMGVAVLACQVQDAEARCKAQAERCRAVCEDLPEWNEYDGARTEFQADTKHQREHIAGLAERAREALARTPDGKMLQQDKDRLKQLRGRLKSAALESRQMVLPFAESC